MYLNHFGLKREPFSIAPDPRFLFMSERHREALAHLVYGLGAGGGVVLLTGEIGAGKTTVFRCLMEQLPKRCNVAYIYNPALSVLELLQAVCDEFHVPVPEGRGGERSNKDFVDALNEYLLRTHAVGQNNVLIIDEAQNLSAEVLEQLRLLTNLETAERKLLQIVLIGQPELRDMLARPELEQLAQRVVARYHLTALTEDETLKYIAHRLSVAGGTGRMPFDKEARQRVYALSGGIPRRINLLCDRALLGAYGGGLPRVSADIVNHAALEVLGTVPPARSAWRVSAGLRWGALALGLAALAFAVVWWSPMAPASRASGAAGAARAPAPGASAVAAAGGASAAPAPLAHAASTPTPPTPPASAAPGPAAAALAAVPVAASPAPAASNLLAPDPASARNLDATWRELARLWRLDLAAGDPCRAAMAQHLACYRGHARDWDALRQLGRPVILTLQDQAARPAYAILTALGPVSATVSVGGNQQTVTLAGLSRIWRGQYATLWRPPSGYSAARAGPAPGAGPLADWIATQLGRHDPALAVAASAPNLSAALTERLKAFQRQRGLDADGQVGPMTLMHLNTVAGLDEPKLQTLP